MQDPSDGGTVQERELTVTKMNGCHFCYFALTSLIHRDIINTTYTELLFVRTNDTETKTKKVKIL